MIKHPKVLYLGRRTQSYIELQMKASHSLMVRFFDARLDEVGWLSI